MCFHRTFTLYVKLDKKRIGSLTHTHHIDPRAVWESMALHTHKHISAIQNKNAVCANIKHNIDTFIEHAISGHNPLTLYRLMFDMVDTAFIVIEEH